MWQTQPSHFSAVLASQSKSMTSVCIKFLKAFLTFRIVNYYRLDTVHGIRISPKLLSCVWWSLNSTTVGPLYSIYIPRLHFLLSLLLFLTYSRHPTCCVLLHFCSFAYFYTKVDLSSLVSCNFSIMFGLKVNILCEQNKKSLKLSQCISSFDLYITAYAVLQQH